MQIYILDEWCVNSFLFLPDRYKHKMTVELMQMVFTLLQSKGHKEDWFYKPVVQGKELVTWISEHTGYVYGYLVTACKWLVDNKKTHYKVYNTLCLLIQKLKDLSWDLDSSDLYYVSFRCKDSYYKKHLNKQYLKPAEGISEYQEYIKWNYGGKI